jgi:glycosyltransferase involved in cell wall biosynthesis
VKTTLGVNIIARDGEKDLAELLPIIRIFSDEIVVILDSRTTDKTKELCLSHGASVIDHTWVNGFYEARNKGLDNTKSNYVAWFDCDDRPVEPEKLSAFKQSNDNLKMIYTFQIRNVPGDAKFNQVRMFPNHPEVRFVYRIHETINHEVISKGFGIAPFDLVVDHHGYKHQEKYSEKLIRNLPLIEEEIKSGSFCPTLKYTYAMNLLTLGYSQQAEYWLRKNICNEVKNSPFRDVYLFSILNVAKILINDKRFSEADDILVKGLIALPDFKEYHALRAHICFHTGDFLTARLAVINSKRSPRRDYAISTDWDGIDRQVEVIAKAIS